MGDIFADGGVSSYPTDLDTRTEQANATPTLVFDNTTAHASKVNELADAVIDVQTKVGTTAQTGTIGSVIFADGTNFAQDNANLFWDDTSNELGVGTNGPVVKLDVRPVTRSTAFSASDLTTWADILTANLNATANCASGIAFQVGTVYNANAACGIAAVKVDLNDKDADLVFITRPAAAVAAERARFSRDGNFGFHATPSFGTSAVGVISVKNGTAPTTGPADTVQFYSTDDATGHTIPSFFCEGTNVLATGQADIATSVRVKMRINGTVVTLLAL